MTTFFGNFEKVKWSHWATLSLKERSNRTDNIMPNSQRLWRNAKPMGGLPCLGTFAMYLSVIMLRKMCDEQKIDLVIH